MSLPEAPRSRRQRVVPPLSLTRVLPEPIGRPFELQRNPGWPADFD
ncbi:MAG TPA: hypothetical protein VGM37_08660 [Armatimonadota bacterium]